MLKKFMSVMYVNPEVQGFWTSIIVGVALTATLSSSIMCLLHAAMPLFSV